MCRYLGCKIKCYRQPNVDYVVNYNNKYPFEVTKYHYASSHPERLLTYNKKIVVPSFATAPLLRKRYYTKYIKPPSWFIVEFPRYINSFCLGYGFADEGSKVVVPNR